MTHDEMIAVIEAHKEGKAVQSKHKGARAKLDKWTDLASVLDSGSFSHTLFDFSTYDYRVKAEPLTAWAVVTEQGAVSAYFRYRGHAATCQRVEGGRIVKLVETEE